MSELTFDVSAAHKWFAMECNNRAWDLLEQSQRTPDEDLELIHTAHAACFHWTTAGTAAHRARAECLVSNAHSAVGDPQAALRHALRCMDLTQAHRDLLADWDLAFADDCMARAKAAAGDEWLAVEWKNRARLDGDKIADPRDKQVFDAWHAAGNWHGLA